MMSQTELFPPTYKVKEVYKWTGEFYGGFDYEMAERLAKEFDLSLNTKINKLSTGYTIIYKVICALCVNAKYILLDEPVLGLDAAHREILYKSIIETYADNPRTIIISTHLIEEVAGVIEDAVIINNGKIIKNEPVETLVRSGFNVSGPKSAVEEFCKDYKVIGTDSIGGLMTASIIGKSPKILPQGLEITHLDLQKLFIKLTKEGK